MRTCASIADRSSRLLLAGLLSLGLGASCQRCPSGDTQGYSIAFLSNGGNALRVRHSTDGSAWTDGSFPEGGRHWMQGAGLAAEPSKVLYLAAGVDGDSHVVVWASLAGGAWPAGPLPASAPERARSAPSIAFLGNGLWPVAFRAARAPGDPMNGDRVILRLLDTAPATGEARYLAGPGGENFFGYTQHDDRTTQSPAVAVVGTRLLLSWIDEMRNHHQALAELQGKGIAWRWHKQWPLDAGTLGVVLGTHHAGFLRGLWVRTPAGAYHLVVQRSADGEYWAPRGTWTGGATGLPVSARVGLAGKADGSLLVAAVADQGVRLAARCNAGSACDQPGDWAAVDAAQAFGAASPDALGIAVVATGQPSP